MAFTAHIGSALHPWRGPLLRQVKLLSILDKKFSSNCMVQALTCSQTSKDRHSQQTSLKHPFPHASSGIMHFRQNLSSIKFNQTEKSDLFSPATQWTAQKLLLHGRVADVKQRKYIHSDSAKSQSDRLLSPKTLVNASPAKLQPYLKLVRLDRPTGTWLIYLPCMWSIALAAPPGCLPDLYYLGICSIGALLMRGAGCTINDMWDKDYDAKVDRTRDRPIPSGQINQFQALTFLGMQLTAALGILLSLNWFTISLGSCVMSLVVVYPLAKRFTYWPHVFLGVTLNWGALIGWSAVMGSCDWSVILPLYAGCVAWTCIYDTIYAHQDKEDDLTAGVKSLPIKLGQSSAKPYLATFASLMSGCLALTGYMADQTWPYYAGVSFVAAHLAHQIYTVDLKNGEDCFKKFRSNRNLGLIFFAAIIAGNMLRSEKVPDKGETEVRPTVTGDNKDPWMTESESAKLTPPSC